ncbi:MAG: hypothetical protein ACXWC2_05670 [Ramlibacter sp.]
MADGIRVLDLEAACGLFDALPVRPRPATLHPRYVAADARRDPALTPVFLCVEAGAERWLHALHTTAVPGTDWRDASSPYGYGGPVSTTDATDFLGFAWQAYTRWMRESGVLVEYVRFHPLLANERWYGGRVQDNRAVVSVDLQAGNLEAGYSVRTRQAVRKAGAANVLYEERPFDGHATAFGAFHRAAMQAMGADPFYLFDDAYFEATGRMPGATLAVCRDGGTGAWLAAALLLDGAGVREYHLAASSDAGRRLGAATLLLHRAALQAREAGRTQFYLGGGTDASEDNPLLFFKSGFSRQRLAYRTGSAVFDADGYARLEQRFAAERAAHPHWPIFHRKV